ncbi:MAG TPA: HPr family phosphocarrier protein [Candidatus Stackebrandtia faecavium]|nr:HPr family phosphocarrier protein [Candidatus Stackebrandtia faecavium]
MAQREVTVVTEDGLRARTSAAFVKVAEQTDAHVSVIKSSGETADGKEILLVLDLEIDPGETITIASEDADIVDQLVELVGTQSLRRVPTVVVGVSCMSLTSA